MQCKIDTCTWRLQLIFHIQRGNKCLYSVARYLFLLLLSWSASRAIVKRSVHLFPRYQFSKWEREFHKCPRIQITKTSKPWMWNQECGQFKRSGKLSKPTCALAATGQGKMPLNHQHSGQGSGINWGFIAAQKRQERSREEGKSMQSCQLPLHSLLKGLGRFSSGNWLLAPWWPSC